MQRIDENTYIDDTLVTCAEYQLFIDEMREQGKYYRPDHWTSYQFLKGQAREPILGIRHSDAIAFCEWLSRRESKEYLYRLPTTPEATDFDLPFLFNSPKGYWTKSSGKKFQFIWIGNIPVNPRRIDFAEVQSEAAIYDERNILTTFMSHAIDRVQNNARALDLDITRELKVSYRHVIKKRSIPYYEYKRITDLENKYASRRNIYHDLSYDKISQYSIAHSFQMNSNQWPIAYDRDIVLAINYALDLFIDLITLQERIAGRSPAFEGIRLVKERIR